MGQYIAIGNVCAWLNLTLMPDGTINEIIFDQPTHGRWEGDQECWASEDDGRTWHRPGVPAPHKPGTVRGGVMNVATGLGNDNNFMLLFIDGLKNLLLQVNQLVLDRLSLTILCSAK